MEEEEGDMAVEVGRCSVGHGSPDEKEQVVEEGGPSVDVRAEEKESEGMREFVSEDCWGR